MSAIPANAKLLCHFDNNLTDSSTAAHTVNSTGAGSTRSSVQSKFGGYSQKFDGTTAYLSIPADTNFNMAGAWTVACWIWTADKSQDTQFREIWNNGGASGGLDWIGAIINPTSGAIDIYTADTQVIVGSTDVSNSAWHYVELSTDGSNMKLFIDGTQEGSTYATSQDRTHTAVDFIIGIYSGTLTTGRWNGYIDEFIVNCGSALNTANYTPETVAWGSGSARASKMMMMGVS